MTENTLTISAAAVEQQKFITKVYGWMGLALLITALVSWYVVGTPAITNYLLSNQFLFFALLIGELIMVGSLAAALHKMTSSTAALVFLGYSALNGLTLSLIFMIFTAESIASTFFVTAATFGVMSAYGYFTKQDLTKLGNILFMGLLGIIIASVVNIFFKSAALYWITTYIGIIVFVGLTAYDTQKIKEMGTAAAEGSETEKKGAILGALRLYLDFINLFILLLRLFGRRR